MTFERETRKKPLSCDIGLNRMSCAPQETVTGSTLNGRKEYLKADEGDKDKWEFLSFANAWTPSETLQPLEGNSGNVKDDVFFTHVS